MRWLRFSLGIAVVWSACAAGCTESSISQFAAPTTEKCRPALSGVSSSVAAGGARLTGTVVTTRDCQWTITPEASWIDVAPASGQGEVSVSVQIAENPQPTSRSGAILINEDRVTILQDPAPCRFELNRSSIRVAAQGGVVIVDVSTVTGCEWTASSTVPWARVTRAAGNGSGNAVVAVEANSGVQRTTSLTIAGLPFLLEQDAAAGAAPPTNPTPTPSPRAPAPCTFQVDPDRRSVPAGGGTSSVRIRTDAHCAWTASTLQSWIHLLTAHGEGQAEISYRVDSNAGAAREGSLTVEGRTHRVEQEGTPLTDIRLKGRVSNLTGSCPTRQFTLNHRQVVTDSSTRFRRGDCSDLRNGVDVEIEGEVRGSGPVQATRLTFERDDDDDGDLRPPAN